MRKTYIPHRKSTQVGNVALTTEVESNTDLRCIEPGLFVPEPIKQGPQYVPHLRESGTQTITWVPYRIGGPVKRKYAYHSSTTGSKVVGVGRRQLRVGRSEDVNIILNSIRDVHYPSWYHGFMRPSYMIIKRRRMGGGKCSLRFGPSPARQTAIWDNISFDPVPGSSTEEFVRIQFCYKRKEAQRPEIWPEHADTDLFDTIHLVNHSQPMRLISIELVLNNITILQRNYGGKRIVNEYDLSDDIKQFRLTMVPYSRTNPVLHTAALELGKAWSPKYFGEVPNADGVPFWPPADDEPDEWCSEFVSWTLRRSTSFNAPTGSINARTMAQYFIGLKEDEDTEYLNIFISPNRIIKVNAFGDDFSDEWYYFKERRNDNNCVDDDAEYHFCKHNSCYLGYSHLGSRIKPGYYAKIRKSGHSTFFIRWIGEFDPDNNTNMFYAIGGIQGTEIDHSDVVGMRRYGVIKENQGALGNRIYWKASRSAADGLNYQDGFGMTDVSIRL